MNAYSEKLELAYYELLEYMILDVCAHVDHNHVSFYIKTIIYFTQ